MDDLTIGEKNVKQSSSQKGGNAIFGIDKNPSTSIKTNNEHNPWWQIDLGGYYKVVNIEILTLDNTGVDNFFIFMSSKPFSDESISEIWKDPDVSQVFIEKGEGVVPINKFGRYLRIQKNGMGVLKFGDVIIWGHYGEQCGNGIDDDGDGDIDCYDKDCTPSIINVATVQKPSCNICSDGVISVQGGLYAEVSFDGGENYRPMSSPYQEFSGFLPGDYDVVVRDKIFGCTALGGRVELRAPVGQPLAHCDNGDFEDGDFTGWKGFSGNLSNTSLTWSAFSYSNFTPNFSRKTILSDNSSLPVSAIPIPSLGAYSAMLGDYKTDGSTPEIEALEYCFIVDNDNANFSFQYSTILQDPNHPEVDQQPFFEYSFYQNVNGQVKLLPNGHVKVVSNKNDPYFNASGVYAYKNWTCANMDLTQYIGEEVCLQFVVADCSLGGHFGVAFIDGLCVQASDAVPQGSLKANSNYCQNQDIDIQCEGCVGVSEYTWKVCRLDASGNETNCVSEHFFGSDPSLDLKNFFNEHGKVLECGSYYNVNLTLENGCGTNVISKKIRYLCESSTINYKDILICGISRPALNTQIEGNNDCDCSFIWQPSFGLLNSGAVEFPIIQGEINTNAYTIDYSVVAQNQVGCLYTDIVETVILPNIIGLEPSLIDFCSSDLECTVVLSAPVEFLEFLKFKAILEDGSDVDGLLLSISEDKKEFKFVVEDWGIESMENVTLVAFWDKALVNDYVFVVPNNCEYSIDYQVIPNNLYQGDVVFIIPNAFTPDGDGVNDFFRPISQDYSTGIVLVPNTFEAELIIWSRWGTEVFKKIISINNPGEILDYNDLGWDGKYKGKALPADTYPYRLSFKNCKFPDGKDWTGTVDIVR